MASLFKRNKIYWTSYVIHGKQYKVSLKTKDKREAEYKLSIMAQEADTLTLVELYDKWYNENKHHLSATYTSLVARSIDKFNIQHRNPLINKITRENLTAHQAFLLLTLSTTSVKIYMRHFRVLLNYAVNTLGILPKNPFAKVIIVKGQNREDSMSLKQVQSILNIAQKQNQIAAHGLELLFLTGMRLGELENLKWNTVADDCFEIVTSKTRAGQRTINLNDETAQCFQNIRSLQPEDCEYVLTSEKGIWLGRYKWLSRKFRKYRDLAGVPEKFVCHSLRHTFATMLRAADYSLDDIQLTLGHTNISTTQIYVKKKTRDVYIKPGFYKQNILKSD